MIASAQAEVVGCGGAELIIHCAQDWFAVAVRLEVRALPSVAIESDGGWWVCPMFELASPSGWLVVGSPTGEVVDLVLEGGPGVYGVEVAHRGRDRAVVLRDGLFARYQDVLSGEALRERDEHVGVERYRVRFWRVAPLPEGWDGGGED
ncbi:hypothetical protein [Umezawaea sp. Da 62-37]|uniref:hypothetical protein n=1 Tax=Umezawaea sp. Da 62-37 TaxID=3075927 RepID=UPI0028F6EB90|nr:hypothetical protein [Umezawaea sp. Da 62-37]WNV88231.1 hypothetical protein RM788_08035 [Umezawaea sp. Da 62-37]